MDQQTSSSDGHNLSFVLPPYTHCGKNHTYHPEDWPTSGEIVIEKCERQCRFRNCKAWSQTAAALRKHVNKHISHNNLPLKIVPASSGRAPLKITVNQDLDSTSYDSLESLINAAEQLNAQPTIQQIGQEDLSWKENSTSKSLIDPFLHQSLPKPQEEFSNRTNEVEQTFRTALSICAYKMSGKVVLGKDVSTFARTIVGNVQGSEEALIKAALSVLGEKLTGKKEPNVRDLANRIVADQKDIVRDLANKVMGDGISLWDFAHSLSRFEPDLPRLTEPSHNSQVFDTENLMHLPDSGYGSTQMDTPSSAHDPIHLTPDSPPDPLAWLDLPPPRPASTSAPLICAVCCQPVATKSELKKHDLRHRKRFKCRIYGCSRTDGFSTTNDLDRHTKIRHPEFALQPGKRYRCLITGCKSRQKLWPRLDNFRSHLKRVHSDVIRSEEAFDECARQGEIWDGGTIAGNALDLRPLHVLADSAASAR